MMAQSWPAMHEPLRRTHSLMHPGIIAEDDDLFNAALLFLDHHEDSLSDSSDSFSVQASEDASTIDQLEPPASWTATHSFQDQLAEVALHMPAPHEAKSATGLFVDTSSPLVFDSLHTQVWTPSQSKPTTPPRRINKRRIEIERLRVESQALQKRLVSLHDSSNGDAAAKAVAHSPNKLFGEMLGSAWQNIAARQLEQRQRSEHENRRLRNMINEHKRMAKALRRLVARHANAKAWDPLQQRSRPPPVVPGQFDAMDDPAIYEELAKTLDTMYTQVESIVVDPKITATNESFFSDVETEVDSDNTMRVRVLGSRTLPFNYAATSAAVWDYTFHHAGPKVLQWEPTSMPDTFQTDFVAYTEMYHLKGLGRAKMMLRRIDEPKRVIILRSALFQCPGGDVEDASGLRRPMCHCMWKIIQKPTHVDLTGVSQIVSSELLMPTLEVKGLDEQARQEQIETLAAMCTQISSFHAKKANEFVDNNLLRRSVESPREVEAVPSDVYY